MATCDELATQLSGLQNQLAELQKEIDNPGQACADAGLTGDACIQYIKSLGGQAASVKTEIPGVQQQQLDQGCVACSPNIPWTNCVHTLSLIPFSTCIPQSLHDIVSNVQEAEAIQKHVHAFGSKWSFSDCAITPDYLINTTRLNRPIQTVQNALRDGQSPLVYHVEAGITIKDLYTNLDQLGLALLTMGGSAGQTLGGAISTGTHGGDKFRAPLADAVLALHLVGAGGIQFWIEPFPGITDPSLLRQFVVPDVDPKNIIYDDATFDACLVSLGCMGVIYAVVLKVREQYGLIETTTETTWRGFLQTADALLNDQNARFLQVLLDPYTNNNENKCLVSTRTVGNPVGVPLCFIGNTQQAILNLAVDLLKANTIDTLKIALDELVNAIHHASGSQNELLVRVINSILHDAPKLRDVLTADYGNIMVAFRPPGTCGGFSYRVMDTRYRDPQDSDPCQPGYSIEMFFPATYVDGRLPFADFVRDLIDTVNAATTTFLTGYVALRFTGPTRAYLGMQQWIRTCSVEISTLPGVDGERALLSTILDKMYQYGGIPHWGQLIEGNVQGHGSIYRRYARWRQVYAKMSNNFTARTFENALSSRWQLTSP